jgi:trehalose utilization protein
MVGKAGRRDGRRAVGASASWRTAPVRFRAPLRTRGKGRIFYLRPGRETYPLMFQPEIERIFQNAAFWAAQKLARDKTGGLVRAFARGK